MNARKAAEGNRRVWIPVVAGRLSGFFLTAPRTPFVS